MLLIWLSYFSKKTLYLIIFYSDKFSQPIYFNVEQLRFVLLRLVNVLEFEIEELFEFLFHLLKLAVLVLSGRFTLKFYSFYIASQPINFLILVLPDFLYPIFYNCLNGLFLIDNFF